MLNSANFATTKCKLNKRIAYSEVRFLTKIVMLCFIHLAKITEDCDNTYFWLLCFYYYFIIVIVYSSKRGLFIVCQSHSCILHKLFVGFKFCHLVRILGYVQGHRACIWISDLQGKRGSIRRTPQQNRAVTNRCCHLANGYKKLCELAKAILRLPNYFGHFSSWFN